MPQACLACAPPLSNTPNTVFTFLVVCSPTLEPVNTEEKLSVGSILGMDCYNLHLRLASLFSEILPAFWKNSFLPWSDMRPRASTVIYIRVFWSQFCWYSGHYYACSCTLRDIAWYPSLYSQTLAASSHLSSAVTTKNVSKHRQVPSGKSKLITALS